MHTASFSIPPASTHRLSRSQQGRLCTLRMLGAVRLHAARDAAPGGQLDIERLAGTAGVEPWVVREILESEEWDRMVWDSTKAQLGLPLLRAARTWRASSSIRMRCSQSGPCGLASRFTVRRRKPALA